MSDGGGELMWDMACVAFGLVVGALIAFGISSTALRGTRAEAVRLGYAHWTYTTNDAGQIKLDGWKWKEK